MAQPTPPVLQYNFSSELGSTFGLHLDANFDTLVTSVDEIIANLSLIQRDDGWIRNQSVGADAFATDALALMAGANQPSDIDWRPLGFWATATLYRVGNIIETGSPAVAYVCAVQHTSGVFLTDYAAGDWVILSAPRQIVSADVTGALGYTPVNKAGDTMAGALTLTTGSKIGVSGGMTFDDTLLIVQDLLTVDKGLYSAYNTSVGDIAYGFASNVVRDAGSSFVVGGQFSAIGTSGATSAMFGGNANAIGLASFADALIGWEVDVGGFSDSNAAAKRGVTVVFKNRGDGATNPGEYNYPFPFGTYASAGSGLGANLYNADSVALHVDSQQRTATGEYCGFTRGLFFEEYALDSQTDAAYAGGRAYPIGIDFSELHYYGGTDPVTSFNLEAALALRDFQTIWWNRDPSTAASASNKVKSFMNPATGRWVLTNGGAERFGVDVATGQLYLNGSLITGGVSLDGNNVWTALGSNTYDGYVTIRGGIALGDGSGMPIQGDFSNPAIGFRSWFQTNDPNSATEVGALPKGTSTEAAFYVMSNSVAGGPANVVRMATTSADSELASTPYLGAPAVPFKFGCGGFEAFRLSTTGKLSVGTTSAPTTGANSRFLGPVQIDNQVAFAVHRNGSNFNLANNTVTTIDFTTEEFDTNNSYDTGTNRFTPPAGKYHLMGAMNNSASGSPDGTVILVMIYKNGAQYRSGCYANVSALANSGGSVVSCLVDANGTDYFELRGVQVNAGASTVSFSGQAYDTYFHGFKIS